MTPIFNFLPHHGGEKSENLMKLLFGGERLWSLIHEHEGKLMKVIFPSFSQPIAILHYTRSSFYWKCNFLHLRAIVLSGRRFFSQHSFFKWPLLSVFCWKGEFVVVVVVFSLPKKPLTISECKV